MRTLLLCAVTVLAVGCASTSTTTNASAVASRLPKMKQFVLAARAESWGADLHQIPAVVIEAGDLAAVPYISFGTADVELNVYGDPAAPAGIEVGTKSTSPETRAAIRAFVAKQLSEADAKPLADLADGKEVETDGMALEITPPEAADGFGAWWVTAFQPSIVKAAQASVGEMNEIALQPNDEFNAALAVPDVNTAQAFIKYPRYRGGTGKKIYATSFYKEGGVYKRRK
jgi:hypothetical protein